MEIQDLHKCDHCKAIAGKKRPVGKYIVELYGYEYQNETKLLCISCLRYYKKLALQEERRKELEAKPSGFFDGFISITKRISSFKLEM